MRRVVLAFACAVATAVCSPPRATAGDAASWAKDLDALIDVMGEKARALLEAKQIDWKKTSGEIRADLAKVASDEDFVRLVVRLVARLRDGHAGIVDTKVKLPEWEEPVTGPRVHLLTVGKGVYVRAAFGEAKDAGVDVGDEVAAIDGVPARAWLEKRVAVLRDTQGFGTDAHALYGGCHFGLTGPIGSTITFETKHGGAAKRIEIVRNGGPNYAPIGPVFFPKDVKEVGRQSYGKTPKGFGYVHLRDVPGTLPEQLDEILGALGKVPGLVLDMRANAGGGCDHEAVFGRFLAPGAKWRQYTGQGKAHHAGPMVVIVDAGVCSAGETVAGQFKEDGRAYMIGDSPTAGMSSQKTEFEVPSGLVKVRFAVASNKGRFNGGKGIEGIGVPPDELVPYVPDELRKGVDTQIRRAEELLAKGFPKGGVPYKPPAK